MNLCLSTYLIILKRIQIDSLDKPKALLQQEHKSFRTRPVL